MEQHLFHVLENSDDDTLADVIPTARDNIKLKALHEDLKKLESVNKKLHSQTRWLHDVRSLFDHVIKHFPGTTACLSPTASLVKFPHFENAVVKLLSGKQSKLSRSERAAVAKLLLPMDCKPTSRQRSAPLPRPRWPMTSLLQAVGT
ncbi:hypothetical protein PHMEG_00023447 [Phytophthora megakarya]|uniref:Uncharacterized protein n=1 Tax=Phytophthora megakarya TaxID=4795 RepID=A0A225VI37_9STRA|nr:hypothetical protein PHMEG_00023447 [Phytophthora megakarya]